MPGMAKPNHPATPPIVPLVTDGEVTGFINVAQYSRIWTVKKRVGYAAAPKSVKWPKSWFAVQSPDDVTIKTEYQIWGTAGGVDHLITSADVEAKARKMVEVLRDSVDDFYRDGDSCDCGDCAQACWDRAAPPDEDGEPRGPRLVPMPEDGEKGEGH